MNCCETTGLLPPYHPGLNPRELVSNMVEQKVAERNVDSVSLSALKTVVPQVLRKMTPDVWENVADYFKKIAKDNWKT